jgi:hypothetical protein
MYRLTWQRYSSLCARNKVTSLTAGCKRNYSHSSQHLSVTPHCFNQELQKSERHFGSNIVSLQIPPYCSTWGSRSGNCGCDAVQSGWISLMFHTTAFSPSSGYNSKTSKVTRTEQAANRGFLRNVGRLLQDYTASCPKRQYSGMLILSIRNLHPLRLLNENSSADHENGSGWGEMMKWRGWSYREKKERKEGDETME